MGDQRVLGCGVDIKARDDPAECVLDIGRGDLVPLCRRIRRREECQWWREPEIRVAGSDRVNERRLTSEHRSTRTTANDPASGANASSTHPGQ
jgi:hypothetical protein